MIQIQDTIVSFDVITKEFCCDLGKCHGACCVEGDAGAPVTVEEIAQIEELLPVIRDMLSAEALKAIEERGIAYPDPEGELVTQIVNGKDCVFTCHDGNGCCCCAIEKAYREGRVSFMKPVSCHLYPIRVKKIGEYWDSTMTAGMYVVQPGSRDSMNISRFTATSRSLLSGVSGRNGTMSLSLPWRR